LQKLTRESVTTRAESGGSGMGLVFCQRVMTSLGGSVSIASELGAGACVTLHFPSQENQDQAEDVS
jgi:two-component system response regulator PhcR